MRRVLSVLGVVAVFAAYMVPASAGPGHAPHTTPAKSETVTLPHGDRVSIVDGTPIIERAPGRQDIPFVTHSFGGRVTVAAADAPRSPAVFQVGAASSVPAAAEKPAATFQLTLVHIGIDGLPAQFYMTSLLSDDFRTMFSPYDPSGTAVISVPAGRYTLDTAIFPADRSDRSAALLVQPVLEVTGDATVVLDARVARPNALSVPDATAGSLLGSARYTFQTAAGMTEVGLDAARVDAIYTGQLGDGSAVPGFASSLNGLWATPDGALTTYSVRYNETGRMISGFRHAVQPAELAKVTSTFTGGNDEAMRASWYAVSRLPGQETHASAVSLGVSLPAKRVRYFNNDGGVQWRTRIYEVWEGADGSSCFGCSVLTGEWTAYRPGLAVSETWNGAVVSPALPGPEVTWHSGVTRSGDTITVDIPMYADGAGHVGDSGDSGSTVLYRDSVQVGREEWGGYGSFLVPAAGFRYRLEARSDRATPYALSTSITAVWEFASARTNSVQALPLWEIRFAPCLDGRNTAAPGRDFLVPVVLTPAPGATAGRVQGVNVDVSYDDGATWVRAPYAGGVALVRHPAGHGFVSLRASMRDSDGNTASVTVLHAYRF